MEVPQWLERTSLLIGEESTYKINNSNILLVGLGGVGSFAGEFLIRAGIGRITIIDGDTVDITNINRQLQAKTSTIGKSKSALLKARFEDINPEVKIIAFERFLEPEDMESLLETSNFDYVLDCIDSITPKLTLLRIAKAKKMNIISSMGAGGKLDPSKIRISDISKSKECKFAQSLRKRLSTENNIKRGITVVFSEEIQAKDSLKLTDGKNYKKSYYGTISYMPALFGLTMAAEVIRILGDLKK